MHLSAVDSSAMVAAGYDESRAVLRVQFHSRAVYDYFGVPASIHELLLSAPSKGSFFNQAIRGQFPFMCNSAETAKATSASLAQEEQWRAH